MYKYVCATTYGITYIYVYIYPKLEEIFLATKNSAYLRITLKPY